MEILLPKCISTHVMFDNYNLSHITFDLRPVSLNESRPFPLLVRVWRKDPLRGGDVLGIECGVEAALEERVHPPLLVGRWLRLLRRHVQRAHVAPVTHSVGCGRDRRCR